MTAQNNTPKPKKPLVSPHFLGYFILMMIGAITLGALQYHYWYGDLGYYELAKLKAEVAKQQKTNAEQERLNTVLTADIADLKSGFGAIEEHARLNLGFIKQGETFVQLSTASQTYLDNETAVGVDSTPAVEPVDVFEGTP